MTNTDFNGTQPHIPHQQQPVADPPKLVETKREKFERIAAYRVNKALTAIERLEQIGANASAYDYGEQDVQLILGNLHKAIERLYVAMLPLSKREPREGFHF
jgi:hypothetical protein